MRAFARRSDPETSQAAAASVIDLRASQQAVLSVLQIIGEATDEGLVYAYEHLRAKNAGLPMQSPSGLRSRRAELVKIGLVIDTGRRDTLPSGRQAKIWAAPLF